MKTDHEYTKSDTLLAQHSLSPDEPQWAQSSDGGGVVSSLRPAPSPSSMPSSIQSEPHRWEGAMPNPGTVTAGGFGEELRRLRMCAGLTLRSLARRVAFDYSYLAQVEWGDRAGSARLAYRCDQALGARGHLVRLFADRKVRQLMDDGRADTKPT